MEEKPNIVLEITGLNETQVLSVIETLSKAQKKEEFLHLDFPRNTVKSVSHIPAFDNVKIVRHTLHYFNE